MTHTRRAGVLARYRSHSMPTVRAPPATRPTSTSDRYANKERSSLPFVAVSLGSLPLAQPFDLPLRPLRGNRPAAPPPAAGSPLWTPPSLAPPSTRNPQRGEPALLRAHGLALLARLSRATPGGPAPAPRTPVPPSGCGAFRAPARLSWWLTPFASWIAPPPPSRGEFGVALARLAWSYHRAGLAGAAGAAPSAAETRGKVGTPGRPFPSNLMVSERSSPSRVRFAGQLPALDCSGPFPEQDPGYEGKGACGNGGHSDFRQCHQALPLKPLHRCATLLAEAFRDTRRWLRSKTYAGS
jgi:hypothetical protein